MKVNIAITLLFLYFLLGGSLYAATSVKVTPASSLLIFPESSAPAMVEALNRSKVPARIGAPIVSLKAYIGQHVEKGQLLASLDCFDFKQKLINQQAQLNRLIAQHALADREYQRGKQLAKVANIGEAELDRLQTQMIVDQAGLNSQKTAFTLAQRNVDRCQVQAPFSGIVLSRLVSEGEMVVKDQPIVELLQTDHLEVAAQIPIYQEQSFQQAKSYEFVLDGIKSSLKLRTLLPFIEANTRSKQARFYVEDKQLIAGLVGRVNWKSSTSHLPADLLQTREQQAGFFILKQIGDDAIAKFIVAENAQEGRPIPFLLDPKTPIIMQGRHGLIDGQKISTVENKSEVELAKHP